MMTSTMKYLKDGVWVDYIEQEEGIKVLKDGNWVDGFDNPEAPDISVYFYDGAKFVQKYPTSQVLRYTQTYKGSGFAYTHSKNSGAWDINGKAVGGSWTSGAMYTGWLGLYFNSIYGGKGNVDTVEHVECTYTRRGIGNWEKGVKIPLVQSTLLGPTGTGTNAQNSKRGVTIYSDDNMVTLSATNELKSGTTTFNNVQAKEVIKEWLNGNTSLVLGYKEGTGEYVGLNEITLKVTYTCKVLPAVFTVADSPMLASTYSRKKLHEMYIYENEIGMTYEEIMEHRAKHNIKDIKAKDVINN